MKMEMFEMKNLLHDTHGSLVRGEEICKHEVKVMMLENNPPCSSCCSSTPQDLGECKQTYHQDRGYFISPRAICFSFSKDDRPKVISPFLLEPCVCLVIGIVVKVKELTEQINTLTSVLQRFSEAEEMLFPS